MCEYSEKYCNAYKNSKYMCLHILYVVVYYIWLLAHYLYMIKFKNSILITKY